MKTVADYRVYLHEALNILDHYGWSPSTSMRMYQLGDETMPLLGALQQACNYDLELYKKAVIYLACKVCPPDPATQSTTWPIHALNLAGWEAETGRTYEDIRSLLLDN